MTTEPKWTKGPWQFDDDIDDGSGPDLIFAGPQKDEICQMFDRFDQSFTNARANAHLISAAPDMAAALVALLGCLDIDQNMMLRSVEYEPFPDAIKAARAALSKARGET